MIELRKPEVVSSDAPSVSLVGVINGPYPKVYFNGFAVAGAVTDAVIVFQNGESTVAAVQSSWSVLKEFARAVDQAVKQNEKQLGVEHLSMMEAAARLSAGDSK